MKTLFYFSCIVSVIFLLYWINTLYWCNYYSKSGNVKIKSHPIFNFVGIISAIYFVWYIFER